MGAAAIRRGRNVGGKFQTSPINWDGLPHAVARLVPSEIFVGPQARVYRPWVTFSAFLAQVLPVRTIRKAVLRRPQLRSKTRWRQVFMILRPAGRSLTGPLPPLAFAARFLAAVIRPPLDFLDMG